jgi:hypothetical protein
VVRSVSLRAGALALLAGPAIAIAARHLPPLGPWSAAALAVAAGVAAALLSTRRADSATVPAGAFAGVLLVGLVPLGPLAACAAFAVAARAPLALRVGSPVRAALVLALAGAGGLAAAAFAEAAVPSIALRIAASALGGLAFAAPALVLEPCPDAVALTRAARRLPPADREVVVAAARAVEALAVPSSAGRLRALGAEVAQQLGQDARALRRLEGEGHARVDAAADLVAERRAELRARLRRTATALERAAVLGELDLADAGVGVLEDLEQEADAIDCARREIARPARSVGRSRS